MKDRNATGDISDPFIFENLTIDASNDHYGIFLGNTTKHVIIRNCTISNASYKAGLLGGAGAVVLYNATNITIENCTLKRGWCGISLDSGCRNNTIRENHCYGNNRGIRAYGKNQILINNCSGNSLGILAGDEAIIKNNTCNDNSGPGLLLKQGSGCFVSGNTFNSNDDEGIHIDTAKSNIIKRNNCSNNGDEGILVETSSNRIENNTVINNYYEGIYLDLGWNNVIKNNLIRDCRGGINNFKSPYTVINNNSIYRSGVGIGISYSYEVVFSNNTLEGCSFHLEGPSDTIGDLTEDNNTVNGKDLLVLKKKSGNKIAATYGQLIMIDCDSMTMDDLHHKDSHTAVEVHYSSRINITDCSFRNFTGESVLIYGSDNCTVSNSTFRNVSVGVVLENSDDNVISSCSIQEPYMEVWNSQTYGVRILDGSSGNLIANCTISDLYLGILISNAGDQNEVCRNNLTGIKGIYSSLSDRTVISHNHINTIGSFPIYAVSSKGLKIRYNTINSSTSDGFKIDDLYDSEISNNSIEARYEGIWIRDSLSILISDNDIFGGKHGIYATDLFSSSMIRNNCSGSEEDGINLYESEYMTVKYNNASNNEGKGIECTTVDKTTLAYNKCWNNYIGIDIDNYEGDVDVIGNDCSYNEYSGIFSYRDSGSTFASNTLVDNEKNGLCLCYSRSATVSGNSFTGCGFRIADTSWYGYSVANDNTVNGRKLEWIFERSAITVPSNAGQVFVLYSDNITVRSQNLTDATFGITIISSKDVLVKDCDLSNNGVSGCYIGSSSDIDIIDNKFNNCGDSGTYSWSGNKRFTISHNEFNNNSLHGLEMGSTWNSLVSFNEINDNGRSGIMSEFSGSLIENNTIRRNGGSGIDISDSYNTVYKYNNLINNSIWGIYDDEGPYKNLIYNNNFLGNGNGSSQAYAQWNHRATPTTWNTTSGMGNYWSNYQHLYPDASNDGITWDTPYNISGEALQMDHHPRVKLADPILPTITDLTLPSATTGEQIIFKAMVEDNIGIDKVWVKFWNALDPEEVEEVMMKENEVMWYYTTDIPMNSTSGWTYQITAIDVAGLVNTTVGRSILVNDNDPPIIPEIGNKTMELGETIELNASSCSDNIGISSYEWTIGNEETLETYIKMIIHLTPPSIGVYNITLEIRDLAGSVSNASFHILVQDTTFPSITEIIFPESAGQYNDTLMIKAAVEDLGGISNVSIRYLDTNLVEYNNSMELAGIYYAITIPKQSKGGEIVFQITAKDLSGNMNLSGPYSIFIMEGDAPLIQIESSETAYVGEDILLNVTLQDESGIKLAVARYSDINGVQKEMVLENEKGMQAVTIPAQDDEGIVKIRIEAMDEYGTQNVSGEVEVRVIIDPYTIDHEDPVAVAGDDVTVHVGISVALNGSLSSDDRGIVNFTWTIMIGQEMITRYGEEVFLTFNSIGTFNIVLLVTDGSGKQDTGTLAITVLEETVDEMFVTVGPVRDAEGMPLIGVEVTMIINEEEFTDNTDEDGTCIFVLTRDNMGKEVRIELNKVGYQDLTYSTSINDQGKLMDQPGAMSTEKKGSGDSRMFPLFIVILIIIIIPAIILSVIFISKKKDEDRTTEEETEITALETYDPLVETMEENPPPFNEDLEGSAEQDNLYSSINEDPDIGLEDEEGPTDTIPIVNMETETDIDGIQLLDQEELQVTPVPDDVSESEDSPAREEPERY